MRTHSMGRYIDELTDEQADRLLMADDFTDGVWWDGECGCLVGTAENYGALTFMDLEAAAAIWSNRQTTADMYARRHTRLPHLRYPAAVERFGKARVVRAIKLRAAAVLSSEVEREPVAV